MITKNSKQPVDAKLDTARPHSREAEQGVLGSVLLAPDMLDDVALIVRAEDFYEPSHRKIYEHMLAMHNASKRIDLTLLVNRLKKSGDFEIAGGIEMLTTVAESCPTHHNATHYARIVRSDAAKREVIQCGEAMIRDAYQTDDADTLIANSEAMLFAVGEARFSTDVKPIAGILAAAMESVDARRNAGVSSGLKSGYPDLDRLTSGFNPGQLIILAGRPHMGKTALATCIIENVCDKGSKVALVSLEMNDQEIGERLLAQRSGVPLNAMLNGTTSPEQRRKLIESQSQLSAFALMIDDAPTRTIAEIAAVCRREKRRRGLDFLVIDYLTQIEPDNTRDPRQEQVAKLSRRLKSLARELKVPLLCLAQLNREVEKNTNPVPRLNHLRESGAIEQDADVVLMIHRPEYYIDKESERAAVKGKAELYVRKARNGQLGVANLVFMNDYGRFESAARGAGPADFGDYGSIN